jgi:5'(3')-deoxyribonucleotidase
MPVYDGAKAFVTELRSFADVVVVTSPYAAVPNWCHQRINWLAEHFGIPKRDVIFAKRKELVAGDCLIDDKVSNVDAFALAQPNGMGIVFDRPWNRDSKRPRARSYAEALRMIRESVVGV